MNKTILLTAIIAAFIMAGCASGEKGKEGGGHRAYSAESIQKEIDDNWESLGYAEKPIKYIALTFDDGPAGAETQEFLDILSEKRVRATFFLIGRNIRSNKTAAQAIFEAGHELANHSDGYAGLGGDTAIGTIRDSLAAASAEIRAITGEDPWFFRAPNVAYGANLAAVCAELGMPLIGANVWSNDWQSDNSAEQCKNNVLSAAKDGGVINCHEANTSGDRTLPILAGMIDGLREGGFWIMSVGELAAIKGKTLTAGERYDSID
ncbi:MAG: polysaccharide deacetylase family protein [Treponema sp.]|jgi:peptidoglycan/xylan/chitin deacetylase (PgdA/CDA1 family)|nr:polysaccharide deacetylase family protein [Treponema sp.]